MPCLTGSLTLELECTITDEPRPASLEKTPRFIPHSIASFMPYPTTPPAAALIPKAPLKMEENTEPIWPILMKKMAIVPIIYRITIKGTIFSVTEAIRFSPPTTTRPTRIITIAPVTQVGMPNTFCILPEMAFTCVILPIPKAATRQKKENRPARMRPSVLHPFLEPSPSRR